MFFLEQTHINNRFQQWASLLTKNLNNVYVTIDHAGTEGLGYTGLSAGGSWRDVYITESNTSGFGDQPSDAYGDIHVMKKVHVCTWAER